MVVRDSRRRHSPFALRAAACLSLVLTAAAVSGLQETGIAAGNGITALTPAEATRAGGSPPAVQLRSHRALTLLLPGLDPRRNTLSAADFRLQSDQDPAYREPQPALRLGLDRQATGHSDDRTAITQTRLHLLFAQPLRAGLTYRLDAPAAGLHGLPVSWQPEANTGSIQLNQVGYAPAARKQAFVGNWLGTAGPLPVDGQAGAGRHAGTAGHRGSVERQRCLHGRFHGAADERPLPARGAGPWPLGQLQHCPGCL
jgi:hypothetical protein